MHVLKMIDGIFPIYDCVTLQFRCSWNVWKTILVKEQCFSEIVQISLYGEKCLFYIKRVEYKIMFVFILKYCSKYYNTVCKKHKKKKNDCLIYWWGLFLFSFKIFVLLKRYWKLYLIQIKNHK